VLVEHPLGLIEGSDMTRVRRMAVTAFGGAMVIGSSLSAPPAQTVPAQITDLPPQRYTITLVEVPKCVSPASTASPRPGTDYSISRP
jgi:hypothetical protein